MGTAAPITSTQSEGQHTSEEKVSDNNRAYNRPSLKVGLTYSLNVTITQSVVILWELSINIDDIVILITHYILTNQSSVTVVSS